ncbi:MAG: hypothetical protein ACRD82_02350 [Blastocatellia bacterium]
MNIETRLTKLEGAIASLPARRCTCPQPAGDWNDEPPERFVARILSNCPQCGVPPVVITGDQAQRMDLLYGGH